MKCTNTETQVTLGTVKLAQCSKIQRMGRKRVTACTKRWLRYYGEECL